MFTEERISSDKAARLLNISRIDFLALLRQRGIAYIDYSEDELADEFAAVEKLPPESDRFPDRIMTKIEPNVAQILDKELK